MFISQLLNAASGFLDIVGKVLGETGRDQVLCSEGFHETLDILEPTPSCRQHVVVKPQFVAGEAEFTDEFSGPVLLGR